MFEKIVQRHRLRLAVFEYERAKKRRDAEAMVGLAAHIHLIIDQELREIAKQPNMTESLPCL